MKTTIRKYVLFITSAVFSQLANAQAFPGKCTMYFDKILEVNFYYENGERRARVSEDWSKCKYTERIFYKLPQIRNYAPNMIQKRK